MFWPIKKSGEVLSKLKDRGFQATSLSTYDFSTMYTTLPHNLIKERLLGLIERTFYKKEGKLYLVCNDKKAFFTSADLGSAVAWWLMPRTPDPEVGGSSPTRVKSCYVLEQGAVTPQKYW